MKHKNRIEMTEQDKQMVIEALEYALHKCIDANGDTETHFNTFANAIEVVNKLPNPSQQSEPCGLFHSTDWNGKCFACGEQVFIRESKK